jgi:hypothetical protein
VPLLLALVLAFTDTMLDGRVTIGMATLPMCEELPRTSISRLKSPTRGSRDDVETPFALVPSCTLDIHVEQSGLA